MNNTPPHILVLSDPPARPGYLPRLRYLCDYLERKGYRVTLLTEEYQSLDFAHTYPIITIPMYSGQTGDWAIKTIWSGLTDWHNRVFARKALAHFQPSSLHEGDESGSHFDLVLCTAFSDFPLGAAKRIAEALHTPLVCDIRDLDEQVTNSKYQYNHQFWWTMPFRRLYRAIHIHRRNKVLRAANAVTTVSPWHVEFIQQFNPNTYLVYNGFDEKQFYPENILAEKFCITYIGSLFDWQKGALEAVKEAIGQLSLPIVLEMHTPQHNPIAHNQLGDTIRKSSVMLVLTNPDTRGMLTTKFYEALGCAKPVLCVPSDNGALADLIRYTNAGIATDDIDMIKTFLQTCYAEWTRNGFTRQSVQHREEFSREKQCMQMEEIILHNIHKTLHIKP